MITKDISVGWGWGKGGLCVRLTTLPLSRDNCLEILVATACPALNMKLLLSFEVLKWPLQGRTAAEHNVGVKAVTDRTGCLHSRAVAGIN
jgi:hypothetical protein